MIYVGFLACLSLVLALCFWLLWGLSRISKLSFPRHPLCDAIDDQGLYLKRPAVYGSQYYTAADDINGQRGIILHAMLWPWVMRHCKKNDGEYGHWCAWVTYPDVPRRITTQ